MSCPSFCRPPTLGHSGTISLAPLLVAGSAALAPEPTLGITAALLIRLEKRWHNAFNQVTIHKASDLFACMEVALFPKGAEVVEAVLELHLAGVDEPLCVLLKPPDVLLLQESRFESEIVAYLAARGFVELPARPGSLGPTLDRQVPR